MHRLPTILVVLLPSPRPILLYELSRTAAVAVGKLFSESVVVGRH